MTQRSATRPVASAMVSTMLVNPEALKAIRQRSGMTVTELADAVDIGRAHLSNIEAGRRTASPATTKAIAEALKVPVTAIIASPATNVTP